MFATISLSLLNCVTKAKKWLQLLANMTNVNNMWNAFVDELKIAINKSVLVKQIRPKTMNQPIWFTRSATRIVKITGKLITSHRQPFFQRQV